MLGEIMILYTQKPGEAGNMSQAGSSEGEGLIKWLGLSLKWHNILSSILQPKAQVDATHKSWVYSKSCAKHMNAEAKGFLLHQSKNNSDF